MMTTETTQAPSGTDLVLAEGAVLADLYQKDDDGNIKLTAVIARIEEETRAEHYTADTSEGRSRIKSVAYKIAQSKVAIDNAGKDLGAEARKKLNAINSERKSARERLETLQEEIRKPLTEWEKQEDERKAKVERTLALMEVSVLTPDMLLVDIRNRINEVKAIDTDAEFWGDQKPEAELAKAQCLAAWPDVLAAAEKRLADAEELARLRAAEEERKAKEAQEAREKAEREAQERQEREEQERRDREAAEAQERAQRAAEARVAEIRQRLEAEFTLDESLSGETPSQNLRAILDSKRAIPLDDATWGNLLEVATAKKETIVAKLEFFLTAATEREEAEREAAEEAHRQAEKAKQRAAQEHREEIITVIAEAIEQLDSDARTIATAIVDGKIPHVAIAP